IVFVQNGCGAWTAAINDSWLHFVNPPGPSPTSIAVVADTNTSPDARTGTVTIGPRVFTVHQSGIVLAAPFGVFEAPTDGAQVSGSIAVTGWALDEQVVNRVRIFRDPVATEGSAQIFIGEATFVVGARPDVERTFPNIANNRRAGWGYLLLTNFLPNGG